MSQHWDFKKKKVLEYPKLYNYTAQYNTVINYYETLFNKKVRMVWESGFLRNTD